jgi:TAG lipase/steryl ester hydrolase/phospholipase A2/LPA acyltransferase
MKHASYDEWVTQKESVDSQDPQAWLIGSGKTKFDKKIIEARLEELRRIKSERALESMVYYFDEGTHGNMAGMGSAQLYNSGSSDDRELVDSYVSELADGLEWLSKRPHHQFSSPGKVAFFERAAHAHGRAALMLSGAGSLAPFHAGVCVALWSQGLLPEVISGASGGSIFAAIMCSHDDQALTEILNSDKLLDMFNDVHSTYKSLSTHLGSDDVQAIIQSWIPDITFEEAKRLTGRNLCVSVAPAELFQQSRMLNSVTTPNVMIREAVLASCSVPGFMESVKLQARGLNGNRVPYVASRSWVDGSLTNDLPASRLRRIFNCNFFIASQTNPIVLWSLKDPDNRGPLDDLFSFWQTAAKEWAKTSFPYVQQTFQDIYPLNLMARTWFNVFTQDYTADVNILPAHRLVDPATILEKIEPKRALQLVLDGEQRTWPQVERIKNCTRVSSKLQEILRNLRHGAHYQKESVKSNNVTSIEKGKYSDV